MAAPTPATADSAAVPGAATTTTPAVSIVSTAALTGS
jgi:hypothetical protein